MQNGGGYIKRPTKKNVLAELSAIAFSDFSDFVRLEPDDEEGTVLRVTSTELLKKDARKAVCSVKNGTKGVEIKLYDKLKALELIGRVCGVFSEKETPDTAALEQLRSMIVKGDDSDSDG